MVMGKRILIGGSSGLIGTALTRHLSGKGHQVVRLVRHSPAGAGACGSASAGGTGVGAGSAIEWQPTQGLLDAGKLEGFDAVINMAGAGIGDKRWSDRRKQEITDSRMQSTSLLSETLAKLDQPPEIFLNGSAIGYYGDQGDTLLSETSPAAQGQQASFLTSLCARWEASTAPATQAGIRTILLRTAVVLAADAPFLKRQLPLFKLGLGGRLGRAERWVSWIHIDDVTGAIGWLLEGGESDSGSNTGSAHTADIAGPVNLCAPEPVRNSEFTKTLGRVLRRPAKLATPTILPAALLGKELIDCLTESTRVVPQLLTDRGYQFAHPQLEGALRSILG